jgi:hypothetical protein
MKFINLGIRQTGLFLITVILIGCTSAPSVPPTVQTGSDAELSFDGLHKIDNSKADIAWAKPDFDISSYSSIMIQGGGVRYRPVKNRGSSAMVRTSSGPYFIDDKTRAAFEALVKEIFLEEMQKIERFTIVDKPGPDVLLVTGGLLDVVSMVPPEPAGGRSYVLLRSVGEATLVLELRDSESGTILARAVDRRAAENVSGLGNRSNSVTNSAEVKRLIRFWATRLREGLDGFAQE